MGWKRLKKQNSTVRGCHLTCLRDKTSPRQVKQIPTQPTSPALGSAPRASRASTTAKWPFEAAMKRGVRPSILPAGRQRPRPLREKRATTRLNRRKLDEGGRGRQGLILLRGLLLERMVSLVWDKRRKPTITLVRRSNFGQQRLHHFQHTMLRRKIKGSNAIRVGCNETFVNARMVCSRML